MHLGSKNLGSFPYGMGYSVLGSSNSKKDLGVSAGNSLKMSTVWRAVSKRVNAVLGCVK